MRFHVMRVLSFFDFDIEYFDFFDFFFLSIFICRPFVVVVVLIVVVILMSREIVNFLLILESGNENGKRVGV